MIYSPAEVGDGNVRWWLLDSEEERATALKQAYQAISDRDRSRQDQLLHHLRLYGNLPVEGVNPSEYDPVANKQRLTWNVVANKCDAATARIGKQKPMPHPLTSGGSYSLRRKAKLLKRFLEAQFRISRVYEAARKAFLDATIFGTGILKIYADHKRICVENIHPGEVIVDHHEALYGAPRQMMQRKWISRDVLREMVTAGKTKREKARLDRIIETAGNALEESPDDYWFSDDGVNDQVLVVEAWRLPSGPDAKDGKHSIIVDSGELLCEPWDKDYFPFCIFRWKERPRGFWGIGLAEELNGIQVEINRMLMRMQTAYHLMGRPLVFLNVQSMNVAKNFLSNEIGAFVPYSGEKPEVWTPPLFNPEFYAQLDRLDRKADELSGLSQDAGSPQSKSVSGVSARLQHDIQTERFSIVALNFEQMFLDIARQMIDLAKEIGGDFGAPAKRDRNTIDYIRWGDIEMEEDEYILQVFPVSSLPTLPSARKDEVIELFQGGLIDLRTAKELLDYPDLEAHMALDRAASEDIDRIIENILDGDEDGEPVYEPPDPYMDLNLALKKVQMALNKAKKEGVDEERLEMLRLFLEQTHQLQQRAAVEQQKVAAMAAMGGGGGASALPPGPGAPPATGPQGAPPTAIQPTDGVI